MHAATHKPRKNRDVDAARVHCTVECVGAGMVEIHVIIVVVASTIARAMYMCLCMMITCVLAMCVMIYVFGELETIYMCVVSVCV